MRVFAILLVALCVLQTSCGYGYGFSRMTKGRPQPCGVEFVGVFEDRAELIPGLRNARTIRELKKMLDESDEPGRTNIRARFSVSKVLADNADCLKPGDTLCIIFRSPQNPENPSPLPEHLVGKRFRIVLHDPFSVRYYGRFSCSEWRETSADPRIEIVLLLDDANITKR